MAFFPEQPA